MTPDSATAILRRVRYVYFDAHEAAKDDLTYQPRGRTVGVRTGRPSSQEPPAGDRFQRQQCVKAARLLVDALETLRPDAEINHVLGRRDEVVFCWWTEEPECAVTWEWTDPADDLSLRLPEPREVATMCELLAGAVGLASTQGTDLTLVFGYVGEVEKVLRATGHWEQAKADLPKLCAREGCWRQLGDRRGDTCATCAKRDQRARDKDDGRAA